MLNMLLCRNEHGVLRRPKLCGFLLAASAVILFSGAARAEGGALLALNTPAVSATAAPAELKEPATAQIKIDVPGYTDFDVYSSVNDPLYREGSRSLLKEVVKNDAPADTLRDAPISKEARPAAIRQVKPGAPLKKIKVRKPLHTDPVKAKNTF